MRVMSAIINQKHTFALLILEFDNEVRNRGFSDRVGSGGGSGPGVRGRSISKHEENCLLGTVTLPLQHPKRGHRKYLPITASH